MTRRRVAIATACAALVVAVLATGAWWLTRPAIDGPRTVDAVVATADFDYRIPAGTGAKLDQGITVDLVPEVIRARVDQTIRIVNHDDRTYLLGPFIVGPNETLTQRFTSPGTFQGECVVHAGGQIRLVVTA